MFMLKLNQPSCLIMVAQKVGRKHLKALGYHEENNSNFKKVFITFGLIFRLFNFLQHPVEKGQLEGDQGKCTRIFKLKIVYFEHTPNYSIMCFSQT